MSKRKLEDASAVDASQAKKPKRDKSKYNNYDPSTTKEERQVARRAAKALRKATKAKLAAETAPINGDVANGTAKSEAGSVLLESKDDVNKSASIDASAKARRKAARKAEREAKKKATKANPQKLDKPEGSEQMDAVETDSDKTKEEVISEHFTEPTGGITGGTQAEAGAKKLEKKKKSKKSKDDETIIAHVTESTGEVTGNTQAAANGTDVKQTKKSKKSKDSDKSAQQDAQPAGEASSRPRPDTTSGYVEHPDLTGLPDTDIAQFLETKQISVKDATDELRPITSFEYLPTLDGDSTAFKAFSAPTPIQAATWPYLLAGKDVVGVAETGSGKTLAFGVPCVHRLMSISKKERKYIKACIVSPTRELALQIQEQLAKFSQSYGLKVTCVYGGVNKDIQRNELRGTHIVVATPGRLNDFLQEGSIDLSHADYLVLDEADRMLDKGFEDEVRKIAMSTAKQNRQTLMFTATWPQSVRDLAATFMTKPVRIIIGDNASGELRANARIVQEVEVIGPRDKQQRLLELLKQYQSGKNKNDRILVFCLYKKEATRIEDFIRYKGFNVAGIHGDLSQQKRTESLEAFKNGSVPLLVATDVAARGLDIPAVKLVINVTFPLTAEDYVHRIGRTGRAGQNGRAITFFTEEDKGLSGALINVLKAANQNVPEELLKFGTTVKKRAHESYGAFYKDPTDMKKATKITFD